MDYNWKDLFNYSDGELTRTPLYFEIFPATRTEKVGWKSNQGYKQTEINSVAFMLHRIIWEWHYDTIPEGLTIDHIDRNGLNNKIENLRLTTHAQNMANRKLFKNNTIGYKGVVSTPSGKFQARANKNGVKLYLGLFKTAEEAADCYQKWVQEEHGEFVTS